MIGIKVSDIFDYINTGAIRFNPNPCNSGFQSNGAFTWGYELELMERG